MELIMSRDDHLQRAVLEELNWEPSVTAAHIGVTANAGVVTLTGHVQSLAEKHASETTALRVKGVKGVVEELEVRLPFEGKRGDDEIAAAALQVLAWDVLVPHDSVMVTVDKGWITLSGRVDQFYQKKAAEQDVRRLVGVLGVSNETTIKPANASYINDDILHALHRSWLFDPQTIKVSVEGGNVRLTGTVHSPHEREVAGAIAWAAPGSTSVENALGIVDLQPA
jgi:osmotically-inducible protein OsmY